MRLLLPAWTRTDFSWRRHSTPTRESPRHFCAGLRLCSGQALTTRGRHAQWLVCPTWARDRVGDRPLLRWAHDLRRLGPYLELGRDRATFALGQSPLALPLLCARPRLWVLCICQGLRPLAHSLRAALFSTFGAPSLCSRLIQAEKPEPCPLCLGARLAGCPARAGSEPVRTLLLLLCTGARVDSVAKPALALRVLVSRSCLARVGPDVL